MKKILKPWGSEEIIEINNKYMFKKLFMKKNHQCSLQYHNKKKESVFIISGSLYVTIKKNKRKIIKILKKGQSILIEPKTIHRMKAVDIDAVYLESSTTELNDVIRLEDDYRKLD